MRIALVGPLESIGPTGAQESASLVAQGWVFESIARFDAEGRAVPALAERIEPLTPTKVRIHPRRTVTFSDGAPLRAEDLRSALVSVGVDAVTTPSGEVVAESRSPAESIELALVRTLVFRDSARGAVGTGPFEVVDHSPQRIRLRRRKAEQGHINEVILNGFATERDAAVRTLSGEANLLPDPDPRSLEFFEDVPSLNIVRGRGLHVDAAVFNPRIPQRERVALAQVLSSGNVREWAFGAACPADAPKHPAQDLPAGPPRSVVSVRRYEKLARAIRRALGSRAGELEFTNPKPYFARLESHQFDLTPVRLLVWPPRLAALRWRTAMKDNMVGYSNPRLDAAVDSGDLTAAERALADDPPIAYICRRERIMVVDSRIRNPRVGPFDILQTLPDWEVEQ